MFTIQNMTVEYLPAPMGVHNPHPRFGWQIASETPAWRQTACRIAVRTQSGAPVWDSGVLAEGRSENHVYGGLPLCACGRYAYTVTVTGRSPGLPEETATADGTFEMGLFDEAFTARWIAQPHMRRGWASYLRRDFTVDERPNRTLTSARAYISGLGAAELYLNGSKVGDHVLEPSITNYERAVPYEVFDIGTYLHGGGNAVGVLLGDGWYDQNRVWDGGRLRVGDRRLRLELHLYYSDGSVEKVLSGPDFTTDYSPITLQNVYLGETYDARLEQPGWCTFGFDDGDWKRAVEAEAPGGTMVCCLIPPIRKTREVKPVQVRRLHGVHRDQTFVYDMGENFTGFCRVQLPPSPAGSEYVLRFAEDCDAMGGLDPTSCGVEHLLGLQQDRYIAGGTDGEVWEPRFTYHGFRYVEVTGIQAHNEPPADFLTGFAVHTDLQSAGAFSCSDARINRLQTITRRTVCSNYHGIPEDCPVREKCGWLGDAQLVSDAAISNFDMARCYEKYLHDIATSRDIYGDWTMIAPGRRTCGFASPLWGCAQIVIPWNLYLYYGDRQVLDRYYDLMCAWVAHEEARAQGWIIREGLGDWCPPCGHDSPGRIPVAVSSTAEFFRCAAVMAEISEILGKTAEAAHFRALADTVRAAFNGAFYNAGEKSYGTQGADGVALRYGLVPDGDAQAVAADCMRILRERDGGAMMTGIYANKHMVPAMTEMGYGGAMLEMLFSTDHPSFGTMMEEGATSLWESVRPYDETSGIAASLNHPMQGAFTAWFYDHILGLRPSAAEPGFRAFTVEPYVFGGITHAEGYRDTPYGRIAIAWTYDDVATSGDPHRFEMSVTVPANTRASMCLPMMHEQVGNIMVHRRSGESVRVRQIAAVQGRLRFELEGGSYEIVVR